MQITFDPFNQEEVKVVFRLIATKSSGVTARPDRRKLTDEQIHDIRESKVGITSLSKKYGISKGSITNIRTRKTYQDIP